MKTEQHPTVNKSTELVLGQAKVVLLRERHYYSSVLFALTPVYIPKFPTMAVDKWWRLYYGDRIQNYDVEQLAAVLEHEVNHIIRDHAHRAKAITADPEIYNTAADCEINDDPDLLERLPQSCIHPHLYGFPVGLLAEDYYSLLLDLQSKDVNNKNTINTSKKQAEKDDPQSICGSCAHGEKLDHELDGDDLEQCPARVTEVEADLIRRAVAQDIVTHKYGNASRGLTRWANQKIRPEVDWRVVLRSTTRAMIGMLRIGKADYSYNRLNRRQSLFKDFIIPSMVAPDPQIAIVVDTSGSVEDELLAQAVAEIDGVIKVMGAGASVTVLSVDCVVKTVQKVTSVGKITLIGGGGTNMMVGITRALELKPKPSVIIVLTDSYSPWDDAAPDARVKYVVVVIGNKGKAVPNWCNKIVVLKDK